MVSKFSDSSDAKKLHEDSLFRFGSGMQDGSQIWSAVSKEAEALFHLNENASTHSAYSKASKSYKGVFSFQLSYDFLKPMFAISMCRHYMFICIYKVFFFVCICQIPEEVNRLLPWEHLLLTFYVYFLVVCLYFFL